MQKSSDSTRIHRYCWSQTWKNLSVIIPSNPLGIKGAFMRWNAKISILPFCKIWGGYT